MKKKLMMALSLVLVAALSIGGTVAYLTDKTDVVENTFTVGDVQIKLDEAKVDLYGVEDGNTRVTANSYKLIPGHTYTKDPTIHVDANSENCWIFVKVENGISDIEADTTIAAQMASNGWTAIAEGSNVFYYKTTDVAGKDIPVFGEFTIADNADVSEYKTGDAEGENPDAKIVITGYAVQADGFKTAAEAWAAAPSSWTAPSEAPAA